MGTRILAASILLTFATSSSVDAQSQPIPWNPDHDADNFIGVSDLLPFLSAFETPFLIESCSRGEVCLLEFFSSYGYPNPLIFYVESNCTMVGTPKRGVTQYIRLPSDSVEIGRVIDVVIQTHPLSTWVQQSGTYVQKFTNEGWVTIGGDGPSDFSQYCCCIPSPCVTHLQYFNPTYFRFQFDGETWHSVVLSPQLIAPGWD